MSTTMSDNYRLATVAVNQTPLDWSGNRARILAALRALSQRAGDFSGAPAVVLFPELCVTGYGCEDAFHSEDVQRRALESLGQIAVESGKLLPDTALILGLPLRHDDRIYNCAAVLAGGRVRGFVPKRNLAGDGVHYEPRWFVAARDTRQVNVNCRLKDGDAPEAIPFGPLLFEHRGARFTIEICEDAWVARRPAHLHLERGVDLVLSPSASHFAFDKYLTRRTIALESSRALGCAYVQVNLLGCEAGRMIYDGHSVVAVGGELVFENTGFSFSDCILNEVGVDLRRMRVLRSRTYSHLNQENQQRGESNPVIKLGSEQERGERHLGFHTDPPAATTATAWVAARPATTHAGPGDGAHAATISRELQFLYAVALGLFDYLRKSHSRAYVVSLSGGADSATCALLVQRAVYLAGRELGATGMLRRLGREDLVAGVSDTHPDWQTLTGKILYTIYQSTSQSSSTTRDAARAVAAALGSSHSEVDVQELTELYRRQIEGVLGRTLAWDGDDLALQNVQARARSPMAWLLANTTGSLLITTSNRSEAAVGYCTMDGDTSGGLAPIAGVDKAFIQRWLRFMETEGDPAGGPIAALRAITAQAPTAELRPLEQ